ncbi:MAG: methyltransferase domain-containing protein [Thermodesulfobacteriota bacterium]
MEPPAQNIANHPAGRRAMDTAGATECLQRYYQELAQSGASPAAAGPWYDAKDLARVPAAALALAGGWGNPVGWAAPAAGASVLDLGCGGGIDLVLAGRRLGTTGRLSGIDLAPAMVEATGRALAADGLAHPCLVLKTADLATAALARNFADLVIANGSLSQVPDPARAFRNIFRMLAPGGRMVVADLVLRRPLAAPPPAGLGGLMVAEELWAMLAAMSFMTLSILDERRLSAQELTSRGPGLVPAAYLAALAENALAVTFTAMRPPLAC